LFTHQLVIMALSRLTRFKPQFSAVCLSTDTFVGGGKLQLSRERFTFLWRSIRLLRGLLVMFLVSCGLRRL